MMRKTIRKRVLMMSPVVLVAGLLLSALPLLAAPSDLDPTWGGDGVVDVDFDGDGIADSEYAFQAQSTRDGKYLILIGTHNGKFAMLRYLSDGTLDPQFGQSGVAYIPEPPGDAWRYIYYGSFVVQSDGKIVVTGIAKDAASGGTPFIRFNADGALDATYGAQGVVILPPSVVILGEASGGYDVLPEIAILPDDKIVLTGFSVADEPEYDELGPFVLRITPDGQLDTSFSGDGIIRLTNPGGPLKVVALPNGSALLAGGTVEGVGVTRLNAAGEIDTTYGENGLTGFSPGLIEVGTQEESIYLHDIALFAGGELFLTGTYYSYDGSMPSGAFLARLNADGELSSSFHGNGVRVFPFSHTLTEQYWRATVQANQKVLLAYDDEEDYTSIYGLARIGLDGQFDPTWSGTGLLKIDDYDIFITPSAAVDASGRILSALGGRIRRFLGDPAFGYMTLSPRHRQPHIAPNANLSLTFAGPVTVNAGEIEIRRVSDYALHERIPVTDAARVTGGGTTTITINPSADFAPETRYFVIVHPNSFVNPSGHPFSGVNALTEWHFTTGDGTPVANNPPSLAAIGAKTVTAGQPLTFTASATDLDEWQTLTFTLADGAAGDVPAGAGINSTTGAFAWTPTEAQVGAHTFDVVVTDDGDPALSDAETITVTVEAAFVNTPPTLGAIGAKTVIIGETLSFTATATDPDTAIGQTLAFTLADGAVGDVPVGAGINASTGAFAWTPTAGQIGSHTFDVVVTDDGDPALSDAETITVTVEAAFVNTPPTLGAIGAKSVVVGETLNFTATANDPDTAIGQTLTFTLADGAAGDVPVGAGINASTGAFAWTPSEAQIGSHTFDVVVTDDGDPALSDFETITVTVEAAFVNTPPTLGAIGAKTVIIGETLSFTATATDPDTAIGQTLAFTLADGAAGDVPVGAGINASTGAFAWTPTAGQVGAHTFDVVVTDDGDPALSDFETITVTVSEGGITPPGSVLVNASFEDAGASAKRALKWSGNRLVKADGRVCNVTREGKPPIIHSREGQCAFRFKLTNVRGRYIQQVASFTAPNAGQTLRIAGWIDTDRLTTGAQIQVQLTYSDSKTQLVNLPIPRGTQPYRLIATTFTLPKDAVKARVRVMTGKSKGTLLVDDLTLTVGAGSAPPVDLPAAPDLRGVGG